MLVALRRYPMLKPGGAGEVKAVQKGTAVQVRGEIELAGIESTDESIQVALDERQSQPQLRRSPVDLQKAKLPSDHWSAG